MTATRFDLTARRVARVEPVSFFTWLFTGFKKYLKYHRWLDTRTTPDAEDDSGEQTGDTLAVLEDVTQPAPLWLFPQEFQTQPDPDMFGRMMRQGGQMWLDHRPDDLPGSRYQISFGIVNLTGTRESLPGGRSYPMPGEDGVFCGLQPRERWLAEESGAELMDRVASGELGRYLLAFVSLCKDGEKPGNIDRCLALVSQEPDARKRGDIGLSILILAELKEWYPAWEEKFKGWNVQESMNVLRWKREAAVEAWQDSIRTVITQRFGEPSKEIMARLGTINDPGQLRQLVALAAKVEKIEDLMP